MWETNNMDYSNSESYSESQKRQDLRDTIFKICPKKLNQGLPLSIHVSSLLWGQIGHEARPCVPIAPDHARASLGDVGLSPSPTCRSVTPRDIVGPKDSTPPYTCFYPMAMVLVADNDKRVLLLEPYSWKMWSSSLLIIIIGFLLNIHISFSNKA